MEVIKIKPGYGYVLVEIPPVIDSIKTNSGIELYISTSFEPEKYANVWATVISVPDRLKTKSMMRDREKMHIISDDDDIRLVPGDKVYFHYLTIKNSQKNYNRGTYFEEGGKRYALLPYSSIFFAVRQIECGEPQKENSFHADSELHLKLNDGKETWTKPNYVMLNNWILIEPIRKGQHIEFIKGYGNVLVDDEASTGKIIVTTDTPYRSTEGLVKACPPNCGLEIGDRIVFEKESDVPVEYDLTRTLEKPYWRMKLEDIIARRVGDNMVQLVKDYTLVVQDNAPLQAGSFYIPETAQKRPYRGKVKMIGPDVKEAKEGEEVIFEAGDYTRFPWGEIEMGLLVREEKICTRLLYTNSETSQRTSAKGKKKKEKTSR